MERRAGAGIGGGKIGLRFPYWFSHYFLVILPFPWFQTPESDRRFSGATETREALRAVLQAAAATRHGRGLDAETLMEAEEFPGNLPSVNLLEFLCHRDRYSVPRASPRRPDALHYPLVKTPRTAVSGVAVKESSRVRWFRSLRSESLWDFEPKALAAPLDALLMLASAPNGPRRPLGNAVIAFTNVLSGPMSAKDADRLWSYFEAPVFEQLLGFDGELLAAECEMHHGLHVAAGSAHFEVAAGGELLVSFLDNPRLPLLRLDTSFVGDLDHGKCSCGLSTPRLRNLQRRPRPTRLRQAEVASVEVCAESAAVAAGC